MSSKKDNVPVLYLEIVDQGESGFILDTTRGTAYEQQRRTSTISWIPTMGTQVYLDNDGIKRNKRVRHISGCESIDMEEQTKSGFVPNRNADKIPFDMGFATIRREGSTIGTYDYLSAITDFLDNPLRPENLPALYKQIKVDEKAVELLDEDELLTAAKSKVYALRSNNGDKDFTYLEDKINSYCKLLNVWDETPQRKLILLLNKAMSRPKEFLDIVVSAENTVITEVTHALQLGVIMFDGNTAQYTKESKVISALGKGNMSSDKKIEALSTFLQTPEGNNALTELRAKVEVEKENQFSK